ncbi:MAG: ExeM/NucH family extracellular endonuclease, partial [Pseudomonadota bacterium]
GGGAFADFTARFPDGATIPAGGYQVVALAGSVNFNAVYGFDPDYELYEEDGIPDAVPDMREAISGSIASQGNLTDSGEVAILFTWDGASDLVQDLDYMVWGDKAEAVDKTGAMVDGPDGDSATSTYLADTTIVNQESVSLGAHPSGDSFQRDDLTEGTETQSGGNGVAGDDETSENLFTTWCVDTATPGAASDCPAPLPPLVCGEPATMIHNVQGNSDTSPLNGSQVIIEAVVVGDFANGVNGELNGFFLQEEDADADANPATSEGIFVLTNLLDVELGDRVRTRGLVVETNGLTQLNSVDSAIQCATGQSVTAVEFTLPFANTAALESIEGMAVDLPQDVIISSIDNAARFGEFWVSEGRLLQPTQIAMPGSAASDVAALNSRNRILIDDGRNGSYLQPFLQGDDNLNPINANNPIRVGYAVSGLQGVMHFGFGNYRIQTTAPYEFLLAGPRIPEPALGPAPLKIAALNVLNFFSSLDNAGAICGPAMNQTCRGADTASELSRQTDKLLEALLQIDADIVGLTELENNDEASLQALVDALNSETAPGTWEFLDTGEIGTDAIKVGYIFKPGTVEVIGFSAILDSSVDPGFDSSRNRPALAQTFDHLATGETFTLVVNHLRARSCTGATGLDAD